MLNNVVFNGRLRDNVNFDYTEKGKAYATFILVVPRNYKNKDGIIEPDYIPCILWDKKAETLAENSCRGSLISITGMLKSRSYDNREGERVYSLTVQSQNFDFLETKEQTNKRKEGLKEKTEKSIEKIEVLNETKEKIPNHFPNDSFNSFEQKLTDDDFPF